MFRLWFNVCYSPKSRKHRRTHSFRHDLSPIRETRKHEKLRVIPFLLPGPRTLPTFACVRCSIYGNRRRRGHCPSRLLSYPQTGNEYTSAAFSFPYILFLEEWPDLIFFFKWMKKYWIIYYFYCFIEGNKVIDESSFEMHRSNLDKPLFN